MIWLCFITGGGTTTLTQPLCHTIPDPTVGTAATACVNQQLCLCVVLTYACMVGTYCGMCRRSFLHYKLLPVCLLVALVYLWCLTFLWGVAQAMVNLSVGLSLLTHSLSLVKWWWSRSDCLAVVQCNTGSVCAAARTRKGSS